MSTLLTLALVTPAVLVLQSGISLINTHGSHQLSQDKDKHASGMMTTQSTRHIMLLSVLWVALPQPLAQLHRVPQHQLKRQPLWSPQQQRLPRRLRRLQLLPLLPWLLSGPSVVGIPVSGLDQQLVSALTFARIKTHGIRNACE